jgi:hypothetical protein
MKIYYMLSKDCYMGLVRCAVKCKHLLKTKLLRLEEVQVAAEEDMKHCCHM